MPALDHHIIESQSKAGTSEDFEWLRIRVGGSCMSPFILPKDIIIVRRTDHTELRNGAIVVYKADSDSYVAHRFYGCVPKRGFTMLKLKGDLSTEGFEYVKPEQMLGRVVAVQRANRIIAMDARYWDLLGIISAKTHPISSLVLPLRYLPRKLAAKLLLLLQCSRLYRRLAWHLIGRRIRFRVATSDDLGKLSTRHGFDCDPSPEVSGSKLRTFVALLGKEIAGYICVTQVPRQFDMASHWLINLIWVRGRYRGAGIGRGLLITAAATLHEEGVEHVCGLVRENNSSMLALGRHVDSIHPAGSAVVRGTGSPISAHECTFLARPIIEGLRALKRQGILDKYRGAGCCDKLLDEL
jgi:hypothetical protein